MVVAMTAIVLGSWHTAPSLRSARAAHAVVVADGAMYALGGTGGGGAPTGVERFDGRAWKVVTQLPHGGINAPAAVTLNHRIYLIGGFTDQTNLPTDAVVTYDPATNAWADAPPLPAPRGGHAAVVLSGKIHVLGGGNSQSTLADHAVFDPQTGRWTEAAPLPRSEGSVAAVVFGGRLYAIGGRSGPSDFGDVYIYDEAKDSWTPGPSIPPRGTAGVAVYRGAIYLIGGESQATGHTLGDVLRLAPGAKSWKRVATLPRPRNYARAVVFHDSLYVVGGSPDYGESHSSAGSRRVDRFTLPAKR